MEEDQQQQQKELLQQSNPADSQSQQEGEVSGLGLGFASSETTLSSLSQPPTLSDCDSDHPTEKNELNLGIQELQKPSTDASLEADVVQVEAAVEKLHLDLDSKVAVLEELDANQKDPSTADAVIEKEVQTTEVGYDDDENDGWNWKAEESSNHNKDWDFNGCAKGEDGFEKDSDSYSDNENGEEDGYIENENKGGDALDRSGSRNERSWRNPYPLRPDAEDCAFFMKTGTCKFGSNCKFNHPPRRKSQVLFDFAVPTRDKVKQKEQSQEVAGQTECKYYLTTGGCKFGNACKYSHSREKNLMIPASEFNFLGLPIRTGEKECPYYMRTGSCKYGSKCRFNHPDPMATGGNDSPGYANGVSEPNMSSWSSPVTLNGTAPYVPMVFPPIQGVPSTNSEWNQYQTPMYPTSERRLPTPPAFTMNIPVSETNLYPHQQPQFSVEEFPERPGQPECSYFLKTGDCKFKSYCKFHHPKNKIPKTSTCVLSDKGLPLRPDQNICSHYKRYGICKFGPSCKYDHPVDYDNSASSIGT